MTQANDSDSKATASRREFIKKGSALVVGGSMLGANLQIARSAQLSGSDEIKIALIGCGGRGKGAALQALETEGPITLWAMADAFESQVELALKTLQRGVKRGLAEGKTMFENSRIDVPPERQFAGLDAYQQAIDSGADLVILATPPGFRPIHFEACVAADKHLFCEKPVAVDAPGIRRFLAANEIAKQKNLMVAIGLQRHHDPQYQQTIQRLQDGEIGDILLTRVYWNGGELWVRPRTPEQTEMEYQVNNWYYFNWLCGDHIVEQHIHNLDISNWLRGMHPSEANGMGGRNNRMGKDHGHIFDHHFVEYTYPDGTKMISQCRHNNGAFVDVAEYAHGSKGTVSMSDRRGGRIDGVNGQWRSSGPRINAWHQEHHDLFAALRRGETYNEAEYGAHSTMTAILGRMATYSGKKITWDQAFNSDVDLSPAIYDFAAAPPVVPNADGRYPVPVPGKTELSTIV